MFVKKKKTKQNPDIKFLNPENYQKDSAVRLFAERSTYFRVHSLAVEDRPNCFHLYQLQIPRHNPDVRNKPLIPAWMFLHDPLPTLIMS